MFTKLSYINILIKSEAKLDKYSQKWPKIPKNDKFDKF